MSMLGMFATFPFLLHVLTSFGTMYGTTYTSIDTPVDSLLYWKNTFIDCYRLGPVNGPFSQLAAYTQGLLPIIAILLHFSSNLKTRTFGYMILVAMYFTTQLRLVISGDGPVVIANLYMHIFVFSVLVLYNDNKKELQS